MKTINEFTETEKRNLIRLGKRYNYKDVIKLIDKVKEIRSITDCYRKLHKRNFLTDEAMKILEKENTTTIQSLYDNFDYLRLRKIMDCAIKRMVRESKL